MKSIGIVEGLVGIIQKLSTITASLVDKVKSIGSIKIDLDKQVAIGQAVGDVRKELDDLEKGIGVLELAEQNQLEVAEEVAQDQVVTLNETDVQYRGKRRKLMDNIIYFETIPSVVKINNGDKEALLQEKVVKFEQISKAKNKGSILPLHRCLKYILERGQVHQRAPTWQRWKEM